MTISGSASYLQVWKLPLYKLAPSGKVLGQR